MTSTSDIADKYEFAIATFTSIVGLPNDNDLRNVQKTLLQICLSIRLTSSKPDKVTSFILAKPIYLKHTGVTESFDEDKHPLNKYYPSLNTDTGTWEQHKNKSLWFTRLRNQDLIHTTKHG